MKHVKTYYKKELKTTNGTVIIEGPLNRAQIEPLTMHEALTAFRPAHKQFEALLSISEFEEGRIIVARNEQTIVGYVTYVHPDPMERWSEFEMSELLELGAIEVINDFRGARIASNLLKVSMMDKRMEDYIIISTEYYWHWDLSGTKLSIWDYRKVMEKMMAAGGLLPSTTDDPEIISHPANCLMVRIGKNVNEASVEQFDKLRFLAKHQQRNLREGL